MNSEKDLNKTLSLICEKLYSKSPVFKNEMVNKEVLSTPILTARKQLIKALINFGEKENIGFDSKLFPPERTIYLSLIKKQAYMFKESIIGNIKILQMNHSSNYGLKQWIYFAKVMKHVNPYLIFMKS